MIRRLIIALVITTTIAGCFPRPQSKLGKIEDLQLVKAYPVEPSGGWDPSGLVLYEGSLFTISDKVDGIIYRIDLSSAVATMVPHIRFTPPRYQDMDWEGITVDSKGNFNLISEEYGRILKVTPQGDATWVTPDLRVQSYQAGLFTKENAGFEGITLLSDEHWLGAVEREPRGLVEAEQSEGELKIIPSQQTTSPFLDTLSLMRIADYSGLYTDDNQVFALFRNAHLVVRMEKSGGLWSETRGWSFRHIETDPRWAFRAQTFGQAEGLAIQGKDVYIIFDNNRGPRQSDPGDRRPLLVHARFPEGS